MKKLVIFVKELNYGGIEKQVITLSNSLVNLYDITLVFKSVNDVMAIYNISKKIKTIVLGDSGLLLKKRYYQSMKQILNQDFDIIISTDEMFNKAINSFSSTSRKIFWLHQEIKNEKNLKCFERIVIPTESLNKNLPNKVSVIPNALEEIPDVIANGKNRLITVAKLSKNKSVDDLIDVLDLVLKVKKNVKLIIIGDGEEKDTLKRKIIDKNLSKNILLLGYLENSRILEELLKSTIFVMASKKETFGLSLIEAMSASLPCIAFDDECQLKNIIKNDINGYLIKNRDKEAMANKIISCLEDPKLLNSLKNCAKETSLIYDIKSVKSEWLKIL